MLKKYLVFLFILISLYSSANASTGYVYLYGEIITGSMFELKYDAEQLPMDLDKLVVIIISPGGSVYESLAIFDYLNLIKKQGITVYTVASGICASGALVVLQAGDVRYAQESATLMSHSVMVGYPSGTYLTEEEQQDNLAENRRLTQLLIDLFARRMNKNPAMLGIYFSSKPYMMGAQTALQLGFIDHIIYDPTFRKGFLKED